MKSVKKIVSLVLTAAVLAMSAVPAFAADKLVLSDTTKVNVENTDACFAQVTSDEYHTDSKYYMHYKTSGDWLEAAQTLAKTATAGSQYVLSAVVKHIEGQLWVRVGWDGDASNAWMAIDANSEGTDLGNGWKKYEKTITMLGDQTTLIMHNAGATECYIDSVSLVPVDSDEEHMMDSEFDNVSYNAETDTITSTSMNLPAGVTMQWEAKEAENTYSLHYKTSGDWLEVSQTFAEPLAAGQYVLTAYAKPISGKVWFYVNWDSTGWMATHAADIIEVQPDGWTKYQKTITVDGTDDTNLLFHNDGATEFYIDDISLVSINGGENLVPDGGFGEVTVIEDEPSDDLVMEGAKLTLSSTTKVNNAPTETMFADVEYAEGLAGDTYSLHYKTSGDWFEVSQNLTENAVSGSQYVITVVAKPVEGQLWVRVGWDGDASNAWMAIDVNSEGTDLGNGWKKYEKTITMVGDQNTLLMHNSGSTEIYIGSISLVPAGESKELMPDGGFDEVTAVAEVNMGEYDGKAWDVVISDFDGAKSYVATFTDGEEVKTGSIGFENVEADGGSVAFAIFLHTSRVNATLDVVAE